VTTAAETRKVNLARARKIERHLRPPTLPVGVKFWKPGDSIPPEAGVQSPYKYTWCEFLSLVRNNGADDRETFLVRKDDLTCHIAPAILGFEDMPPDLAAGKLLGEIHFLTNELCATAVETIPKVPFRVEAITIGPLEDLQVEPWTERCGSRAADSWSSTPMGAARAATQLLSR